MSRWATSLTKKTRTDLLVDLLRRNVEAPKWISAIAGAGEPDDPRLARAADKRIRSLSRAKQRLTTATNLAALRPHGPIAQGVMLELVTWLVSRPHAADTEVAIAVLQGWTKGAPGQRTLENVVPTAIRHHKVRLTQRQGETLKAAGIKIPRESVGSRLRDFFFR